mgnify:CR=1 FL=1
MILYVLILIFVLFIILALLREPLSKIIKVKICAICGAVSITWIALIVLYFLGYFLDKLLIGILMGESVTGLMYLFERRVEKTKYKWLLVFKILIIIAGTAVAYLILK